MTRGVAPEHLLCSPLDSKPKSDDEDFAWELLEGTAAGCSDDSDEDEPCSGGCRHVIGEGATALGADGIARLRIPPEALAPLRVLANALLEPIILGMVLGTDSGQEVTGLGSGWPRFRLHNSTGSDSLLWLYASDEKAMGLFEAVSNSVISAVAAAAAGDVMPRLCACSLVILRSPGARDSEVFAHRDWDEPSLPPLSAFTALIPLVLPDGSAGLELFDDSRQLKDVAAYVQGEAVVFDNRQLHRTQPGRSLKRILFHLANRSPARILASLSFAPMRSDLWPAAERVLRGQTPHFYRTPSAFNQCF